MKITVAMCTYNGEKYLAEQLDSILSQTVLPDEIVIHDDHSTDNTYQILLQYQMNHGEVKWHIKKNEENVGYKKSFFDLLKLCDGDYVFLCDQDDIWVDHKIERMISVMQEKNASLLMSNFKPLYMHGSKKVSVKPYHGLTKIRKISLYSTIPDTPRPGCTYCISHDLLQNDFSAFQAKYAHDLVLFYYAAREQSAYLLKENLIYFRRHATNASSRSPIATGSRVEYLDDKIQFLETMKRIDVDIKTDQYLNFFKKRKKYIENHKITGVFYLFSHIFRYSCFRFFISDLFYLLFSK